MLLVLKPLMHCKSPVEVGASTWVDLAQRTTATRGDRENSQSELREKKNPIERRPSSVLVQTWIWCRNEPRLDPARHVVRCEATASGVTANVGVEPGHVHDAAVRRVHKMRSFT
jgi:hypothetical protein